MRNTLYSLIIIGSLMSLIGCGGDAAQANEAMPTDAAGLRKALKQKKSSMNELKREIEEMTVKLEELDPTTKKKIHVKTQKIAASTYESYATFQGNVVADEMAYASSQLGGTITSMTKKEGDYVKKGDLIAVINSETMDNQRIELETSLSLAKTVYERQKRLWDQNIGSEIQYLQAKNNKERLEKTLATLQSQINLKNVYAPIPGYIEMVMLKQGELAGPGSPIVQILNSSKLKIETALPENFLVKVKRGKNVEIYFPSLDLDVKRPISQIGRQIDPTNRTFTVETGISSMGGKIKPNLLTEMKIKDEEIKDVIMVPINLVQEAVTGENYVYIIQNGMAKKRNVVTGQSNDASIIIESGIELDDELVVVGANQLENGAPVIAEPFVEKKGE